MKIRFELDTDREYKLKTIENSYDKLESMIKTFDLDEKEFLLNTIEKDKKRLNRMNEMGVCWHLLVNLIKNEFSGNAQLLNNYEDSKITIYNDKKDNEFGYVYEIRNGVLVKPETEYKNTITTNRDAIYIETPYFLDYKIPFAQFNYLSQKQYHQTLLYLKLTDQKSKNDILDEINNEDTIKFQKKINELLEGEFNFNNQGLVEFNQNGKTYNLPNTSTGLKSLGILQLLLENRKLKENTFLIMDEPEVHLHPEWQVKLAHILVLLVKDLNVTLFINSHSPQFIEAIEVYSVKYGLKDKTNFYLTEEDEKSKKYNVRQIQFENLYEIYENLGDPYDILDEIRGENLANHL